MRTVSRQDVADWQATVNRTLRHTAQIQEPQPASPYEGLSETIQFLASGTSTRTAYRRLAESIHT